MRETNTKENLKKCRDILKLAPPKSVDNFAKKQLVKHAKNYIAHVDTSIAEVRFKVNQKEFDSLLDAIVEVKTEEKNGLEVIKILEKVSRELETVFSVCIINRCKNGISPFKAVLEAEGYNPRINCKTNVGLGRPLA